MKCVGWAKGPNNPPGGSTKVDGQQAPPQPRTVKANIAYATTHDTVQNDDDDFAQGDSADDETAAYLASVLHDSY
jgi:hypothetical protein